MCRKFSDHFLSALFGGVVGAVVVLFATGQKPTIPAFEETVYAQPLANAPDAPNGKFKVLEVENLVISGQASVLGKEGNAEIVFKDGSVLVENMIFSKKMVTRQLQSHAVVANRMFATPDDLVNTPMDQWKFFAEIGTSVEAGGEVIVRSVAGPATVAKPTTDGVFFRTGFDPESQPQILALQNSDRSPVQINFGLSEQQKKMLAQPR